MIMKLLLFTLVHQLAFSSLGSLYHDEYVLFKTLSRILICHPYRHEVTKDDRQANDCRGHRGKA